jgi:ABC-2 type transport system ATP-binding protein
MRLLVGLIHPTGGSARVLGGPVPGPGLRRLGAIIEEPSFYPYLSGRDNLRVLAAAGAPTPRHRLEEMLELVGLRDRARDKVKTYSLGMRQRLGIAGALLSDPDLLLLDEPANGLDPGGIVAMRALLRALASSGKTVLVSSHILPEVEMLADLVGIVDRGRLVREGPLSRMLEETGHVRVRVPPAQVPAAAQLLQRFAPDRPLGGPEGGPPGWLSVPVAPSRSGEINRALAEAGIHAEAVQGGSDLESLFLSLTAAAPPPPRSAAPPPGWGQPPPGTAG